MQDPPIWQRLLAALAYLLPWADAIGFGNGVLSLAQPLQLLALEQAVPFGGLVLFLALFLLVVRNQEVPYLIRNNLLQANLIDLVLVQLSLAFQVLLSPLGGGFAVRTLESTVFLATLLLVVFSMVQSLRGIEADIPTVSEAVRMQL